MLGFEDTKMTKMWSLTLKIAHFRGVSACVNNMCVNTVK